MIFNFYRLKGRCQTSVGSSYLISHFLNINRLKNRFLIFTSSQKPKCKNIVFYFCTSTWLQNKHIRVSISGVILIKQNKHTFVTTKV